MDPSRASIVSQLIVACFSRHPDALAWAEEQLTARFGPIAKSSADFAFNHTRYYEPEMGPDLRKRLLVFEPFIAPEALAEIKHRTIALEAELAASGRFPEERPLNLDPGLLQLGKLVLASTKNQSHRIYLRDGIFAEVTLRFQGGTFEAWPWTYADYREAVVLEFLNEARERLHARLRSAPLGG